MSPGNSPDSDNYSDNYSSDEDPVERDLETVFTGTRRRSFNVLKFISWKNTMLKHVITDAGRQRPLRNMVRGNNEVNATPSNATGQSGETQNQTNVSLAEAPIQADNSSETQTASNIEPNVGSSSSQNNEAVSISPNTSASPGNSSEQMALPSTSRFFSDMSSRNSYALKKKRKRKYELRHTRIKLPYYKSCLSKKLFKK